MSEWINVDERMPELSSDRPGSELFLAYMVMPGGGDFFDCVGLVECILTPDGPKWKLPRGIFGIVAWMPLPKASVEMLSVEERREAWRQFEALGREYEKKTAPCEGGLEV